VSATPSTVSSLQPRNPERGGLTAAVDYLVGYDLFISYARRDGSEYAEELKRQLDAAGVSCFLDKDDIAAGLDLRPSLARALRRSVALAVIVTPLARSSAYVALEIATFAANGRPIVPVRFGADAAPLPWSVLRERELVWVDETGPDGAMPTPASVATVARSLTHLRKRTLAGRLMLGVSAALLALSLVAVVAGLKSISAAREAAEQQAIAERKTEDAKAALAEAERRRTIATVESLARQVTAETLPPDLAVLLASEAVRRAVDARLPISNIAEHALRTAVARTGGAALHPNPVAVEGAATSTNGRWLMLGVPGKTLLYDLNDPLTLSPTHPANLPIGQRLAGYEQGMVLDGRGATAAIGYHGKQELLFEFGAGQTEAFPIAPYQNGFPRVVVPVIDEGRYVFLGALYQIQRGIARRLTQSDRGHTTNVSRDGMWLADFGWDLMLWRLADAVRSDRRPRLIFGSSTFRLSQPGDFGTMQAPKADDADIVRMTPLFHGAITEVEFSPDSRWMIAVSNGSGGGAFLWDLRDKSLRPRRLGVLSDGAAARGFSADSHHLVVGEAGGAVAVYRLEEVGIPLVRLRCQQVSAVEADQPPAVTAVGFSEDKRWLGVAVEGDVCLWRMSTVVADRPPDVHLAGARDPLGVVPVTSLAFSSDGRWLVSAGRVSRLLDLAQKAPETTALVLTKGARGDLLVDRFLFSPDSRWLISAGYSELSDNLGLPHKTDTSQYRVWPLAVDRLMSLAPTFARRPFSRAEWDTIFPGESCRSAGVDSQRAPTSWPCPMAP
jgi:hypothetical protein